MPEPHVRPERRGGSAKKLKRVNDAVQIYATPLRAVRGESLQPCRENCVAKHSLRDSAAFAPGKLERETGVGCAHRVSKREKFPPGTRDSGPTVLCVP